MEADRYSSGIEAKRIPTEKIIIFACDTTDVAEGREIDIEGWEVKITHKLPPLVFEAQTCAKDSTYVGVDVVRCRRNGLANAPFPLPILCPADGVEPVDCVLPDLGFVEGCCDARQSCLNLLPYVGPGWYPKVSLAAMLDLGVCRWDHIVLGISARSHVDAATLRRALERMDAAWPDGEEHQCGVSRRDQREE